MSSQSGGAGEHPLTIIFMGAAGSGKTTAAEALARDLNWPCFEADDFHSQENIRKMSAGVPLDDSDREPWLKAIADKIGELQRAGADAVFTCSALKASYRKKLCQQPLPGRIRFVFLKAAVEELRERLAHRAGHFMKLDMLDSQLKALQEPGPDEALIVDASLSVSAVVAKVKQDLGLS